MVLAPSIQKAGCFLMATVTTVGITAFFLCSDCLEAQKPEMQTGSGPLFTVGLYNPLIPLGFRAES